MICEVQLASYWPCWGSYCLRLEDLSWMVVQAASSFRLRGLHLSLFLSPSLFLGFSSLFAYFAREYMLRRGIGAPKHIYHKVSLAVGATLPLTSCVHFSSFLRATGEKKEVFAVEEGKRAGSSEEVVVGELAELVELVEWIVVVQ